MESRVPRNQNDSWTDEKHVHFLNSMEAWFVHTMLENNGRFNLRLDRDLPDSCESTLDCKYNIQTRKKHTISAFQTPPKEYIKCRICLEIFVAESVGSSTADFIGITRSKVKGRPDKRSRRPSSQPHDSSQDQVVPQIENRTRDKDEKGPPNVPVASMALAPAN